MKSRNPYAKAVTRIRPQVIPGRRRRTDRQEEKRKVKEDAGRCLMEAHLLHKSEVVGSIPAPAPIREAA